MKTRYLLDTSIWIEFFRGHSQIINTRIFDLLNKDRIVTCGVVLTELLLGAKGKKEIHFVNERLVHLNYLGTSIEFFILCGNLGKKLRQSGINVPLSDLMIAAQGKMNSLTIFTTDKHFETIGKPCGVAYEILENF
jgi:predicted nucleic acid-binding protein